MPEIIDIDKPEPPMPESNDNYEAVIGWWVMRVFCWSMLICLIAVVAVVIIRWAATP